MKNRHLPSNIKIVTNGTKRFLLFNLVFLMLAASIFILGGQTFLSFDRVEGDEPTYTITLDASNTPSGLSAESFGTGTSTARYVDFDYTLAKLVNGHHVSLQQNGRLDNAGDTRITSIKWIKAIFTGGTAELTTGWRDSPTTNQQVLTSNVTADFTNNPYYYSIKNTGEVDLLLTSLEICYSCAPRELKGSTTYFGMYPQSEVTDEELISSLNTSAGTLPTSSNSQAWTSYGYYISNSNATSFMWYIDLTNDDNQYRGVYFTSYRPYLTNTSSTTGNSFQDDNDYFISIVYWFKYEPITWRVLDVVSGKAFLMANLVLDSQDYYHSSLSSRTIGGATVHANNYMHSNTRSWLNDNFYNTAFTTLEQDRIQTTDVDNSVASTGYDTNDYACDNTNDKVFLLSHQEATSATYGLDTDTARQRQPSDYAQSQGVWTFTPNGNSGWWLRSPNYFNLYGASLARYVHVNGYVDYYYVDITHNGVVPALWISV